MSVLPRLRRSPDWGQSGEKSVSLEATGAAAPTPYLSPYRGILLACMEERRPYDPRKNVVPLAGHHVRIEEQ